MRKTMNSVWRQGGLATMFRFIVQFLLVCAFLSGFGVVGQAVTLWHNTNTTTIANNNTQICVNGATNHWDNSHWRSFTPSAFGFTTGTFTITGVRIGIEVANAGGAATTQPINVRIYTNSGGAFPAGTRTQIASLATTVADGNFYFQDIAITGPVLPVTTEIVVEIHTPSSSPAGGNFLRLGSNNLGQSAPSYRSSGTCGPANPTDMATTGAPFTHLLIGVISGSPTASPVNVGGYVLTQIGRAPRGATVTLTDLLGNAQSTAVNRFGHYQFNVEPAQIYFVTVEAKGYNFTPPTHVVTPNFDVEELNFTAFRAPSQYPEQ